VIAALTSLSPAGDRRSLQHATVASWRAAGMTVYSFNHASEIATLAPHFDVSFVAVDHTSEAVFGRPYVPINAMLAWAAHHGGPVMILNADVELRLAPLQLERLRWLADPGLCYFVRHNHDGDLARATIEPWGFDAFLFDGRTARDFPETYLSMGKPVWDYWLPLAFAARGLPLRSVEFPVLFHRSHELQWSWTEWHHCIFELDRLLGVLGTDRSLDACVLMAQRMRQHLRRLAAPVPEHPDPIRTWVEARFRDDTPKVFLELGAHRGWDTAWMSRLPAVTIHAFEPDPRNELPALTNVVVTRAAVAERDGTMPFHPSLDREGEEWTFSSSLRAPKRHLERYPVRFGEPIEVPTIALDSYRRARSLDTVDFIWCDIQGAEGDMVRGGRELLASTRYLFTEYSNDELYEGQCALGELLAELPEFRVVELWEDDVLLANARMLGPHHARTVTEFLLQVVRPGSIVFDVGCYRGMRTERYRILGARVVCLEPLPDVADWLATRFGNDRDVTILPHAAGRAEQTATLSICSRAPYLSTLAEHWKHGRFRREVWDRRASVQVTTLDRVIAQHGSPAFCKLDVEGYEREVLAGLGATIPGLSFEFARETVSETAACLARLCELGYRRFNLALAEDEELVFPTFVDADRILATIRSSRDKLCWGDVYALAG
jgi:FkbM family methyltransferase